MKKFKSPQAAFMGRGVADPTSSTKIQGNNLGSPKTPRKESHTAPSKYGMGDYYGTGVKNKMGRIRDSSTAGQNPVAKSKLIKPPKSLA